MPRDPVDVARIAGFGVVGHQPLAPLIAWDDTGAIISTLEFCAPMLADGVTPGPIIDWPAIERSGVKLRTLYVSEGAAGAGTWPEFLGEHFHEFEVELDNNRLDRVRRLRHRSSKHVRDRDEIEYAIALRQREASERGDRVVDLRDIVGGPERFALLLDEQGRTVKPSGKGK